MAVRIRSAADLAALRSPRGPARTPRAKPRREEAALLRACLELLRLRGVFHFRAQASVGVRPDGRGGWRPIRGAIGGTPDVLLVLRGRLVGVEVKSPAGRLRAAQAAWRDRLLAAGGLFWEIRDVKTLEELLRGEGVGC